MNGKNLIRRSDFIEFDDENLEHVMAGPDYGQPDSGSHAWSETDSKEYPNYVENVREKILSNWVKVFGKDPS